MYIIYVRITCIHDEVVSLLARLFRCLRVDAIVEPIRIFADLDGGGNSDLIIYLGIRGVLVGKLL